MFTIRITYSANAPTRKPWYNTTETIALNANQRLSQSIVFLSPVFELHLHLCDEGAKLFVGLLELQLQLVQVSDQPL